MKQFLPKQQVYLVITAGVCLFVLAVFIIKSTTYSNKPDTANWPKTFGYGHTATASEIAAIDIDVRPDGIGLPPGEGYTYKGKDIYIAKCAACHGADGTEIKGVKLPGPPLVSSAKGKAKTIGNYWPYATTLFDYLRRAMPYNAPGSLTNEEVYNITAYLLSANKIIKPDVVLNAKTLPLIVMPAKKLFIVDDRKGGNEVK